AHQGRHSAHLRLLPLCHHQQWHHHHHAGEPHQQELQRHRQYGQDRGLHLHLRRNRRYLCEQLLSRCHGHVGTELCQGSVREVSRLPQHRLDLTERGHG